MTNTPRRGHGPLDIEIGKRIRMRRLLLNMTQRTLAVGVGISWQQVHKYERGINRIGTSRLTAIAGVLGVPISYFVSDPLPQASQDMPSDVMERPETLQLVRLYYAIRDETVRRQVLAVVEAVAEKSGPPSEVGARISV